MALYTTLDRKKLKDIMSQYGSETIVSYNVLTGGSENSNYKITTDQASYVLTVCEKKNLDETQSLARLLAHLKAHAFNSTVVVESIDHRLVTTFQGKPVVLKEYLHGTIYDELSPDLLTKLGRQIGKLHSIVAPEYLPNSIDYGHQNFRQVSKYSSDKEFDDWLKRISEYIEPYFDLNVPRALIHSDIFADNVIVDHAGEVIIMDFEEATFYYRMYDVGMAIIGTCCSQTAVIPDRIQYLLQGYIQEVKMTTDEQRALQAFTVYAGASMTFWRHRNFNYLKPNPALKDHYRGLQILSDSARNLEPECFKIPLH